jgi:RNA polymerase sigma factor (sigma-70 family)
MEAGALRAPAALNRISVTAPFLRLRSDEQLVALFRAGNDAAFSVIHDRYRQRLFAYSRQMLGGSRQDAEDALQDVFLRAYSSLRTNDRPLSLRAWLYRVAHNRCIDHLRRPTPPAADLFDTSRKPLHDPMDEAERREDLRQLVADVRRLPEQQRSALLMREIDGLSYVELSEALGVSLQAVKSLLVRARIGLVEAVEARNTACSEIRVDLADAFDRGVRASGLARRHLRDCDGCVAYRTQLRTVRQGLGVLAPGGPGPFAAALKLIGLGGAGSAGAASAGGGAAAGGGALTAAGTGTAVKFAAVVCCAALTAGGAVEVHDSIVASGASTAGARDAVPAPSQERVDRALRAAPAIAAAAARAAPARPSTATEASGAQTTVGRRIRSAASQTSAVAPATQPFAASQHTVDTSTGGAPAPREDTGFGYGADGMTPRAEPSMATAADPQRSPSSGTGESGSAHATPSDAIENGGESRPAASAETVEIASGSIPPG